MTVIYYLLSADRALGLVQSAGNKFLFLSHKERIFSHFTFGRFFEGKLRMKTSYKMLMLDDVFFCGSYHPANCLTNFLGSLLVLATMSKLIQGAEEHRDEEAGAHREDAT